MKESLDKISSWYFANHRTGLWTNCDYGTAAIGVIGTEHEKASHNIVTY
jgi:hypothetical protein